MLPETSHTGSSEAAFLQTSLLASKAAWAVPTLLLFIPICLFHSSPTVPSKGGTSVVPWPLFAGLQLNWVTSAELKRCSVLFFFNSLTDLVVRWVSDLAHHKTLQTNGSAAVLRDVGREGEPCCPVLPPRKKSLRLWPEAQPRVRTKTVIVSMVSETSTSLIRMIRNKYGNKLCF